MVSQMKIYPVNILRCLILLFIAVYSVYGQNIHLNELMSSNSTTIYDESGNTPDWIELYNSNNIEIDLTGFGLSDNIDDPFKWIFPSVIINPESYVLIFASGEGGDSYVQHWETVINWGANWNYFIGYTNPPSDWREL